MRPFLWLALAIAFPINAVLCTASNAALVLDFSADNGATFSTGQNVVPGTASAFDIFLRQTDSTTTLTDDGLSIFTIAFNFNDEEINVTDLTLGSGIFDTGTGYAGRFGTLSGLFFSPDTSGNSHLGRITFQTSIPISMSTGFTFLDFDSLATADDIISGTGDVLDSAVFPADRSYSYTITAVPEPSSCLLAAIPLLLLAWRRQQQKRKRYFSLNATKFQVEFASSAWFSLHLIQFANCNRM